MKNLRSFKKKTSKTLMLRTRNPQSKWLLLLRRLLLLGI